MCVGKEYALSVDIPSVIRNGLTTCQHAGDAMTSHLMSPIYMAHLETGRQ